MTKRHAIRWEIPRPSAHSRPSDKDGSWGAIIDRVLRRPLLSALFAGGLLVALALPALQLRMVQPGAETYPTSLPVVQTYDRMQQEFPGTALPATVVVKAPNVNAPVVREATETLEQRAVGTGRMHVAKPVGDFYVQFNGDLCAYHVPGGSFSMLRGRRGPRADTQASCVWWSLSPR
jgi:uncharacterized membrane protein YdfJ with MMPL/SSD domain